MMLDSGFGKCCCGRPRSSPYQRNSDVLNLHSPPLV